MNKKCWLWKSISILSFGTIAFLIIQHLFGNNTKKEISKEPLVKDNRDIKNFETTYEMLYANNHGLSIVDYLKNEGIHSIAVYGMGQVGRSFIDTLRNDPNYGDGFTIEYGIDMNVMGVDYGLNVVRLDAGLKRVDAIVVSLPHLFESIKNDIENSDIDVNTKILSIENVVKNDF